MTVAQLIDHLERLDPELPIALRTVLPDQRIRWDDIEAVEVHQYDGATPVVLIR